MNILWTMSMYLPIMGQYREKWAMRKAFSMKCHRARNGFDALLRHWATVPRIARIPALNPCQQKKNGLIGSFALLENWPLENASHSFLVAREWNMDDLIVRQSKTMTMKSSILYIKKETFPLKTGYYQLINCVTAISSSDYIFLEFDWSSWHHEFVNNDGSANIRLWSVGKCQSCIGPEVQMAGGPLCAFLFSIASMFEFECLLF